MIKLACIAAIALALSLLACASKPDVLLTPYDGGVPAGGCATDSGLCDTGG